MTATTTRPRARWRTWTGMRAAMAGIIVATGAWLAFVAAVSASIATSPVLSVPAGVEDLRFAGHLYLMAALGLSLSCVAVAALRNDRRWLYPVAPLAAAGSIAAVLIWMRTPGPTTFSSGRSLQELWFGSSLAAMVWMLAAVALLAAIDWHRRREADGATSLPQ